MEQKLELTLMAAVSRLAALLGSPHGLVTAMPKGRQVDRLCILDLLPKMQTIFPSNLRNMQTIPVCFINFHSSVIYIPPILNEKMFSFLQSEGNSESRGAYPGRHRA